jgi:glutamate/tyrosine decarboxylase-like PLP-dependent enzyme
METAHDATMRRLNEMLAVGYQSDTSPLATWLEIAREAVPPSASASDPYVQPFPPTDDWTAAFEEVPDCGWDAGEVVRIATMALAGVMRPGSPRFFHNITPPVAVPAVALAALVSFYNPNALWDQVSGGVLAMERQLGRQLARLAGCDPEAEGVSTFGGKAGLIYAIRLGLNRCLPTVSTGGLAAAERSPVVLTTAQNHYTIRGVCSLVGLGTDAVVEVATDGAGRMLTEAFLNEVVGAHQAGRRIAAVVLCGGNTLDGVVDPAGEICRALVSERLVDLLGYRPWIHVDLPVGWPWLFFRGYDADTNPAGLPRDGLDTAVGFVRSLDGVELSDSFTVDFHKLGFCAYPNSMFVTRSWSELRSGFRPHDPGDRVGVFGENPMQHHTIEHSRSSSPIIAAWTVLQILGADGFRSYLAHCHHLTLHLRRRLHAEELTVLNPASPSLATLVTASPPGPDPGPGDAAEADLYLEDLYRFASGLDGGVLEPLALGFVPGYQPPRGGSPVAAIRWYVANPALDAADVTRGVAQFMDLKRAFDHRWTPTDRKHPPVLRISHTPR